MKHATLTSLPLLLLSVRSASAQTPVEATPAPFPPLIVQAEAGRLGAEVAAVSDGTVTFVSVLPSPPVAAFPGNAERVLSYDVTFPEAGEYELYLRFRVGPGGGNDDSVFYASSFGIKDPALGADWVTVNGLSSIGYTLADQIVAGGIGLPLGSGFRWVNLSEYNGGEEPLRFSVTADALTQTLQLGVREDGFDIDQLALVRSDVSITVAEIDAGLPGNILPPAPPPRVCTPRGPALAVNQGKFLGGVHSPAQLPSFLAYFNQLTPENAGKWGAVEAERDVMTFDNLDAAYQFAKDNGLPIKMHVMVWGNQQPAWIETLPPEEQLEEIREWFAAVSERYPDLDTVDVVNEPLHDPPNTPGSGGGNYIEALGGAGETGWDWVVNAFRLGREYFPGSQLMLNDYSITNTPADVVRYKEIIALLAAEDLIDAIGVQGHAFSTRVENEITLASLDSLADTGLPIYVTELDIDGPTDEVQLADYQRIFPVFWEHPSVMGITLWGYRPGHWRTAQGAFLALESGAERPALAWLRDYLGSPATTPVLRDQVFQVEATAPAGTIVGQLQADAEGPNSWLVLGGDAAGSFSVSPETGEIRVADGVAFDAELSPELHLEVVARDECTPTSVTIGVLRPNTAPRVVEGQVIALDAQLVAAGGVSASDAEGDTLTFSIVGGTGATRFSIEPASGVLSVSAPLDFTRSEYTLDVVASDGREPSTPATLSVTLPSKVQLCLAGHTERVPRPWVSTALRLGADLGACTAPEGPWLATLQRLLDDWL
jgi:GH35 family endo-1,4-beta-xylanase